MTDVVVIGAGIVGAACAYYLSRAGLRVTVVDRAGVAGGTTGAGEGNILVSDKEPGPELDLALWSLRLWRSLPSESIEPSSRGGIELETKGGLVVAGSGAEMDALSRLAEAQRQEGVEVIPTQTPVEYEQHLNPALAGGMFYPQDMQVQPMLAAAHLLRASGAQVRLGTTVAGVERGRVHTDLGTIGCAAIVNATGVWSLPGVTLPVLPRRGFVLVTGRVGKLVRHKVYAAAYVANVGSSSADLQTSPVVEGTAAGTVLIGSSRERAGFDGTFSLEVLRRLAAGAIELFPVLAGVQIIRAYRGFRPYTPDHLPIIGPDPRVPGLFHATGHEGAGVGLAPATGELISCLLTGREPEVDPAPFRPGRFA